MLQALVMLSRQVKVAIMIITDTVLLMIGLWLALSLRYGMWWTPTNLEHFLCMLVAALSGVSAFAVLGLYRWMIRYVSAHTVALIMRALLISALLLSTAIMFLRAELPRSTPIIYILVAGALVIASRFIAQAYLRRPQQKGRIPVVIYGAGVTGSQLALSLHQSHEYRPVAFVDDKTRLQGMMIYGLKVGAPDTLAWLIEQYDVKQILLAIPSLSQSRRREILLALESHELKVSTVPAMTDIVSGRARLDDIKDVDVEDLLGRDVVPARAELMSAQISHKNVLVTGAGGSIGSELCRQIMTLQPTTLVLYEQSEYALYQIDQELHRLLADTNTTIIPVLGSVRQQDTLQQLFIKHRIDTVFHAAAYKHVPLVEANIVEGVANNVFGTLAAAQAALAAQVKTFVLISTDKAVRPTNIMGATKRLAELILQAFAQQQPETCFCMVRFGNVLGSSGSVVPLFKEQIRQGGPVTVTHPDVIRYFMTIPEAAQLVIQTSAMAKGGDVFLLDMGEPVRIADLAKRMIHLMGHHVKSEEYPDGIDIQYTGLRAGEKLFEELLVDNYNETTEHPRIYRALESYMRYISLMEELDVLEKLCQENNVLAIYQRLAYLPLGFISSQRLEL
ncbi:polysaccharide biosynthesis protein [Agitococcus lubricus]|uniref:FlaA1/EpsC-like NDP-sugar epimerase n=1 Tax=Agitococcus lubricus TaxID=1077255 RepID=A0A2T5J0X9_9GAMM|nr:nucleoside-diphosphate sugar epimerase/dehydratase [Agitococcus lubricus]PTQ90046.1 FlaA1/EpsC-like NDP-sugar epimerase [Agitococcus lubricus]